MENVKELADFWTNVYLGLNSYDQENIFGLRSKDLRKCALRTAKVLLDINAPNRHKNAEELKQFDNLRHVESDDMFGIETSVDYQERVIKLYSLSRKNEGTLVDALNNFYGSTPLKRSSLLKTINVDSMSLWQIKQCLEGYGFKCQ